ncbi:MAG: sigma-54 dependent transcriptional regulator [Proteobacteria bacterium]|nr:sigma-54 dependent transcriptional regulator [Pseudomonadota bacterium]
MPFELSSKLTILLVDDEQNFLHSLAENVQLKGFSTVSASSGEDALAAARSRTPHLAIVDHVMPGIDGLVTIAKLRELRPGLHCILLTGHSDDNIRQTAVKLDIPYFEKSHMGAFWEYLLEFGAHPDRVGGTRSSNETLTSLEALAAQQTLDRRRSAMFPHLDGLELSGLSRIIGECQAMVDLKRTIDRISALDCAVLLLGETGTGKEMIARVIHETSQRKSGRFLALNCGSLSPDQLESELLGHTTTPPPLPYPAKKGIFEAAKGGTVMLDEIGDAPRGIQRELQQILGERTVTRIGSNTSRPVDVRILTAATADIETRVDNGTFLEDLYYRLNVFTLRIPPLRERGEDIELLASFFLNKYCKVFDKQLEGIDGKATALLQLYRFPGNVRELENVIERAVILCEQGPIRPEHLPERFRQLKPAPKRLPGEFRTLAAMEREHVLDVLKSTGNNKSEAAVILGINRASLWRKLKRYEQESVN